MVEEVQYESTDYLQLIYEKDVPFSDPISRNKLLISLNTSRNDSRSRHFQGGMMPNTRGTTLHLLLWVVQSPPLHLYNKFDGTAESSQLISLAAAFPSPFADWLSFSRLREVEQQCNESYQSLGKSALSGSSFSPLVF